MPVRATPRSPLPCLMDATRYIRYHWDASNIATQKGRGLHGGDEMKFNLGFVVRDAHSNGYDSGDLDKREPVSYTLGEAFVFPTEVQAEDRAKVLLSAHPGRDFVVSAVKFVAQQLLTTEEHKEYINEITRMYIKDSALILQDYLDQEKGQ